MGLFDRSSSTSQNINETSNATGGADAGAALAQGEGTALGSGSIFAGQGATITLNQTSSNQDSLRRATPDLPLTDDQPTTLLDKKTIGLGIGILVVVGILVYVAVRK